MKKTAMWAFIFTALAMSTYMTLANATNSNVIDAYARERYIPAQQYYAVFDKTVRERVHRHWFSYYRITRQLEVCTVTKSYVEDIQSDHKVSYIGKSKQGAMFYKIKPRYQSELRPDQTDCVTVKRPWWNIFIFNGGGHVS